MGDTPSSSSGTGKELVYGPGGLPTDVLNAVFVLAALALMVTIVAVYQHLRQPQAIGWRDAFRVAWIFWIFAPPIWFSVEYFLLFKPYGQPGTFEAFKYGQELAYRTWVGIATAMTLLYVQGPL